VTEPIPYTNRFVVRPDTGRKMARAWLGHVHRTTGMWVFYGLVISLTLLPWTIVLDGSALGFRAELFWALALSLVVDIPLIIPFTVIGYVQMLRSTRLTCSPGTVVESGYGEDAMVLRGAFTEIRLRSAVIESAIPRGDFVFMQQRGARMPSIWPLALFPGEAMFRIKRATRRLSY
jgi:hypothetical protein